jgi:hypothetical protein
MTTEIDKLMPPVSRLGDGSRAKKSKVPYYQPFWSEILLKYPK